MKIDPGLKQTPSLSPGDSRPVPSQANPRTGTEQTDVSLSQRASELKQLETRLAAIPLIDRARVDSIKEAIANGQYTVNPQNIAAGLLDSVKEMLHVAK